MPKHYIFAQFALPAIARNRFGFGGSKIRAVRYWRFLDKPPRLSLLEYLYFAGDDRFGALGVSTSEEDYRPRRLGPLPVVEDAETIQELVRRVIANEPIEESLQRLISPGVTLGGAHPKALRRVHTLSAHVTLRAAGEVMVHSHVRDVLRQSASLCTNWRQRERSHPLPRIGLCTN